MILKGQLNREKHAVAEEAVFVIRRLDVSQPEPPRLVFPPVRVQGGGREDADLGEASCRTLRRSPDKNFVFKQTSADA